MLSIAPPKKIVITKKKEHIFEIFDISQNKCIYFSVEAAKVIIGYIEPTLLLTK